ncbi:SpoVR family protein, partial [Burkholderia cenocepacia]|nr:SpoVR family protein [Burkholderia cenocepacia]
MTTRHLHNESRGYEPRPSGDDTAGPAAPQQHGQAEPSPPAADLPGSGQKEARMNVAERKPLPCPSDWTFELLEEYDTHISQVAEQYELDIYPIPKPYYSGINPYALGFSMMSDIRRICEAPTEEDYKWFPEIAGTPWLPAMHYAMRNFKDESFIAQYLSPNLIREMRLFSVLDDDMRDSLEVSAIH